MTFFKTSYANQCFIQQIIHVPEVTDVHHFSEISPLRLTITKENHCMTQSPKVPDDKNFFISKWRDHLPQNSGSTVHSKENDAYTVFFQQTSFFSHRHSNYYQIRPLLLPSHSLPAPSVAFQMLLP